MINSYADSTEQYNSSSGRDRESELHDLLASVVTDLRNSRRGFKTQYSTIMPSLPDCDYEALRESIKENGLLVPLVISQNGVLLDGYYRLRACTELNIRPKYHKIEFKDKAQEMQFVIGVNLNRRQLKEFQRVELGHSLQDIETDKAKRRMFTGRHLVRVADRKDREDGANSQERKVASTDATLGPDESKGKVSQIIAKKIGVSSATYERQKDNRKSY